MIFLVFNSADNTSAVVKAITQCQSLVSDALQEIEEAEKENGVASDSGDCWNDPDLNDDVPGWTDHDRDILGPSLGLVKAALACVKKCAGVATKSQHDGDDECQVANAQDELNERLQGVSPAVDELVSCLYPPLSESVIVQNVSILDARERCVF